MACTLEDSTVLIADDDPSICSLLEDILAPSGLHTLVANSGHEAMQLISEHKPDLAIIDVRMPEPDGLTVLQHLRQQGSDLPVLIMTALRSSTTTIEAMRNGAADYLSKPFDPEQVINAVQQVLAHRAPQEYAMLSQLSSDEIDPRDTLIGQSAPMQAIYKLIGLVAFSDATILITGESGTGKQMIARILHATSTRSEGPFVTVNCAALPETLLESELFGHEKGAFTGAVQQRKGRFEQAHRGTIFLDEIGEMSLGTQKKLLHVLQERSFERVGGNTTLKVNVRILAATNRDLEHAVAMGTFREDLYYRLNVINMHMPALRERREDIPLLVDHFLRRRNRSGQPVPRITRTALERLLAYDWPGNVRQLENTIERAVVLSQGGPITPEHVALPTSERHQRLMLGTAIRTMLHEGYTLPDILATTQREAVDLALSQHKGDRVAAARSLGVETHLLDPSR